MTRAEMTEIFAVLMLAYPNAEMFKAPNRQALMDKLAPTITLWATCLADVDFWTGQQAAVRVCNACKFPPTIAEFREQAEAVTRDMRAEIDSAYLTARSAFRLGKATGDGPGGNCGATADEDAQSHSCHGRHRRLSPPGREDVQHERVREDL